MIIADHIFQSKSFIALIDEAIEFMLDTPLETLPPEKFYGGGIYALYYKGNYPLYYNLFSELDHLPIYIGKAVLPGWRQGRESSQRKMPALFNRLKEHARSIQATENLEVSDFLCRFMVLQSREADLIGTVEAAMTRRYHPLWNSFIDGFGNHDPGKGRYEQAKSEWDVLHPGRVWADRLKGIAPDQEKIIQKVKAYHVDKLS